MRHSRILPASAYHFPCARVRMARAAANVLVAASLVCLAGTAGAHACSPFDDCVWWFDGGRLPANVDSRTVVSGQPDLFDIMHAATPEGDMHLSSMVAGAADGATITNSSVNSPLTGALSSMPVLAVPQKKYPDDKYYPNYFELPASVKQNFSRDSDVTVIARVRLVDSEIRGKTFFMMNLGYKAENGVYYGMPIGFICDTGMDTFRLYYWSRLDSSHSESLTSEMAFAPNEWVDVAFVLRPGHTALGMLKSGQSDVEWTEKSDSILNCGVGGDSIYICRGNSAVTQGGANRSNCFAGDIARIAIWNRALSKQEVFEAFAFGGADQAVIGLKNGDSSEFGGSTPISSVEEGFSWKSAVSDNAAPRLASGDGLSFSFRQPVNKDKADGVITPRARQKAVVFALTDDSAPGILQVQANDRRVFTFTVEPGEEYACVVRSSFLEASSASATPNAVSLVRTDTGSGNIELDYVSFSSDWQVGYEDASYNDLTSGTGSYSFNMYAEPWTSWEEGHSFRRAISYSGYDEFTFYVPPALAATHESKYVFARRGEDPSNPESITGLYVDINGVRKFATDILWGPASETSATYEIAFEPGELRGGYNTIRFGPVYDSSVGLRGWVYSDFHRFEWVYRTPQQHGLRLLFR